MTRRRVSRVEIIAALAAVLASVAGLLAHAAWTNTSPGLSSATVGARPAGVAVHAASRLAVVANEDAKTINLVHLDSGDVTATIAVADGPKDVLIDPTRSIAYVLHDNGRISVIDITAASRTAEWNLGTGELEAFALNPAGTELIVGAEEPNRLVRVNTTSGAIVQTVSLAHEPQALAFSPDGTRLYVATENGGIRVYNASTWAETTALAVNDVKALAYWTPGDRLIAADKRRLHIINTATNTIDTIAAGAGLHRLTLSAANAYALDKETNAVAVVDLSSRTYSGRYAVPDEPAGIALDANTGRLLVTLKKINQLVALDPATATLTPGVFLGEKLTDVAVDNKADRALAIADKEKAYVINLVDKTNKEIALSAKSQAVAIDAPRGLGLIGLDNKQGVRFLNLATQTLLPGNIPFDPKPIAIGVDSNRALAVVVVDKKDQVLLIDIVNRVLTKTLTLPGEFKDVAIHPGRGNAYLLNKNNDAGELVILNLTSQTVTGKIPVSKDAKSIVIDPILDLAVLAVEEGDKLEIIDLATNTLKQSHALAKHPRALAINPDTHTVVVANKDGDAIALLDLATQTLTPNFATVDKPLRLDVSQRYNQALVIAAEKGEIVFIQLPNPLPVLTEIVPPDVTAPAPAFALLAVGQHFIDSSKVHLNGQPLTTRWKDTEHLEADIPASLLAQAGVHTVKVVTPTPGGGESQTLTFTVQNPVPALTAVSPTEIIAGNTNRTLTVTGDRFVQTSVVRFGAADLATTYVDDKRLTAVVPGTLLANPATVPVTVFNPVPGGGSSNAINVTIVPAGPKVDAVTPNTGEPGTLITLTGSGFESLTTQNQVSFAGNVAATVQTATNTELRLTVPPGALSGPITVTTPKGTTQSPSFTVKLPEDFQLVASPATVTLIQNAANSFAVQLTSTGTQAFTSLVKLSAQGLPSGVSAEFNPKAMTANQAVKLTLHASGTAVPETFNFTIIGTATLNGRETTRTATATVTLQPAGQTGVKGRFVDPNGNGIAGVYVRYETLETTSDAAGNFMLLGLPAGKVTLRMDATPANALYPIWPYEAQVEAGNVLVLNDWVINPPPPIENFKPLVQNSSTDQVITDNRYPGLKFTIPAGASIIGWDGVPKDKIAVERIDVDKLPVPPPPVPIKETYQLYFGTPMGGIPSQPIPVSVPNVTGLQPGEQTELWYYDGSPMGGTGEWKLAGPATISSDGQSVSTDAGYGIPRFCGVCGLFAARCEKPPRGNSAGPECKKKGNPVDLLSGYEMPTFNSMRCGGLTPRALGLSYHPVDAFQLRAGLEGAVGHGWVLDYDIVLADSNQVPQNKRLILPPNTHVDFVQQADGSYTAPGDARFDGAVLRLTAEPGRIWELTFKDQRKWRFGMTDSIGLTASFLIEQIDSAGNRTSIERRSDRKITAVGDNQRRYRFTYGTNNLVEEIRDPIGRAMRFTYNSDRRIDTLTDADGGVTRYTYVGDDEFPAEPLCPQGTDGQRIKTIHYPGSPNPTVNHHGPSRRVLRQVSAAGLETKFEYQLTGACVVHTSNPGVRCTGTQCPSTDSWDNYQAGWRIYGGQVVATTVADANGRQTHTFNARGYTTQTTDANGQPTREQRDAQNRVTRRIDPLGRETRYVYDAIGNLLLERRDVTGENQVIAYDYDPKWNKITQTTTYKADGTPLVLNQQTYDTSTGNLTRRTDANGHTTTYSYTAKGQLQTITDPRGQVTRLAYNDAGDLTRITDPLGHQTELTPDAVGRTIAATDALGYSTQYNLNARDQQTQITDASGNPVTLAYDIRGNLTSVTNQNNRVIETNTYDDANRLLTRTDGSGRTDTYTYDAAGNVNTYTDRNGQTTTYNYDTNNRLQEITYSDGSRQNYSYDALGRLVTVSDAQGTISYHYDSLNRIAQVTTPQGTLKYAYDSLNRRTQLQTPQQTVAYGYDDAGNLTQITYGAEVVAIDYDENNRRRQLTYPNGIIATYTYDDASRLTGLRYQRGTTVIEQITYAYDPNGNIIQRTRVGAGSHQEPQKNATYDPNTNRLISLNGETFQYDNNGNLTTRTNTCGTTTYTWNVKNQLTGINGYKPDCAVLSASFQYDALGRRTQATINNQTTTYLHDGMDVIAEMGQHPAQYLRTNNIDEAIARYTSQEDRYLLTDLLGSTLMLTDDQANPTTTYSYSPFGETAAQGESTTNPVQYTGRENDQTGMYYYRARYYVPRLGRFVASDPIGLEGGLNTYAYVLNNPLRWKDPRGLEAFPGDTPWLGPGSFPTSPDAVITDPISAEARGAAEEIQKQLTSCTFVCDLVVSAPCKSAAVAMPTGGGKVGVYVGCNVGVHYVCKWVCEKKDGSCPTGDDSRDQGSWFVY